MADGFKVLNVSKSGRAFLLLIFYGSHYPVPRVFLIGFVVLSAYEKPEHTTHPFASKSAATSAFGETDSWSVLVRSVLHLASVFRTEAIVSFVILYGFLLTR